MSELIELRKLKASDYDEFRNTMAEAYSSWGAYWKQEQIEKLVKIFPEGQLVICVNGKIVAGALSIIIDYKLYGTNHTFRDVTGGYTFDTHTLKGDTLYGIEVFVHPAHRGRRFGRRLYDARKELCEELNLRGILFGGRMPNYHKYKDTMSPKEYLHKVDTRQIADPTLNFQMSNDFHPIKVMQHYMPGDQESGDYAVLLEWDNIYYQEKQFESYKENVRLGLIQWQMRLYKNEEELMQQAEFFIDALAAYKADFAVLPEFFNAPLLALYNNDNEAESFRKLSNHTEGIRKTLTQLAVKYNINIITGSMPGVINNRLHNIGYLCKRNGEFDMYEKIHVTPDEAKYWAIQGGEEVRVFDTDCGKIGILICYDVEFPELPRLLADQGMNILFVPFLTDTQSAYNRVRHCAQARAIENECFVAICGSVGNLPKVENMDIQYAQSAVFTPCDFAFPTTGVKSEATANTEMLLVADVDLTLLDDLHNRGSVTNLKDRRKDLYTLSLNRKNTNSRD
jgi:predicted amidohydrolase/GNAT superfamily N-acetyltransferase